ncbi:ABC transporter permease subunit [Agromyces sp. CFH 90414]|uniref:ABC transporter permease subunit n=1 Tax=Agromyces agglutinans TaxID=2662258 RepID=A0A6I2F107_9MICO|nr:ABC transporter permease [Agromyces agglutinans]MRG59135.1 ABC transporter permease subunit [Agromyces agglutinans]
MSTQTQTERREPRFAHSVGLVAGREISTKLRSKAFVISTLVLMAGVLVSVVLSSLFGGQEGPTKVAVVGAASEVVAAAPTLEGVPADDLDAAEQLLRDGDVDAVVAPSETVAAAGIETTAPAEASELADLTVIGLDQQPQGVMGALAAYPSAAVLDPAPVDAGLAYLVAFGFGIVFFFAALTFGSTIAQAVVEEKQTRIVEILLSTVSARALLTGKVLGNAALALGQVVAIAVIAILGLAVTGQQILLGGLGISVAWFIVFFAFGFLLLSALFAATAATVSRVEDVGSVTMPVMMLVMIPYFLIIFFNDNPTVLAVMSYVPFSAPVGMPMRIFLEQAAWWEPLLSLAILIGTTAVALLIGDRIYRNSLLRMGARVPFMEALRGR